MDDAGRGPLAEALKSLRDRAGLSQKALADLAGVNQQYIARVESGRVRYARDLPRIAAALGCQTTDIDPNYKAFEIDAIAYNAMALDVAGEMDLDRDEVLRVVQSLFDHSKKLGARFGFVPTLTQTLQHLMSRSDAK